MGKSGCFMYNTNINRADLKNLINMDVNFNEVVNTTTDNGNAVLLNEKNYTGLLETLYLSTNKELKASIIDRLNTPLDELIDESDAEW